MAEKTDVIIIGAGIIGAAIAAHLAARGCTGVLVLEQAPREMSAASARSAGGVRHQFSEEVNIRLSQLSVAKLDRFADEYDIDPGWRRNGYLLLFSDAATWRAAQANVARQRRLGVRVTTLTPDTVAEYVPGTRLDDLMGATFGADDGVCDPHTIAMAYLHRAQEKGIQLRRATTVTGMRTRAGAVIGVETPAGDIDSAIVVNAAGAWAGYVDANGFSGHGVMHAPAVGQLLAEEILDGRAHSIDIDALRVHRFDAGVNDADAWFFSRPAHPKQRHHASSRASAAATTAGRWPSARPSRAIAGVSSTATATMAARRP